MLLLKYQIHNNLERDVCNRSPTNQCTSSAFINHASEVVDGDADIQDWIINTLTPAEIGDPASRPPPTPSVTLAEITGALFNALNMNLLASSPTRQWKHTSVACQFES